MPVTSFLADLHKIKWLLTCQSKPCGDRFTFQLKAVFCTQEQNVFAFICNSLFTSSCTHNQTESWQLEQNARLLNFSLKYSVKHTQRDYRLQMIAHHL